MASKGSVASTYVALLLCLNLVSSTMGTCSKNLLDFRVCADVLNLVSVGTSSQCCSLISGLVNLQVAACLCTALKANVLGINLNVPVSLSVILNKCGRNNADFQCPP